MVEYVTKELAARSDVPPEQQITVWFKTVESGEVRIRMSTDGLIQLHGLVSDAVGRMPVDSSDTVVRAQGLGVEPRGKEIG